MEADRLHGIDPVDGSDYRIGWCGNGSMSHYILKTGDDDHDKSWYVFIDEKDELYRSIYAAERRLVYKVEGKT
jgi:hypothetical protein